MSLAHTPVSMIPQSRALITALICVCVVVSARPAMGQDRTQDNPTRFDIGAGFATLWQHAQSGPFAPSPGLSLSFGIRVARHLALETELVWVPGSAPAGFKDQGGQALEFSVGARGIIFENRRVSVSGLALPGLVRLSNTITAITKTIVVDPGPGPSSFFDPVMAPATHFALGLGFGVDVRLSDRITARVDALSTLYAYSGTPRPTEPGLYLVFPSAVAQRWQMSIGAVYALGSARPADPPASTTSHPAIDTCDVGVQFAATVLPSSAQDEIRREPGLAGFVSCRVVDHIFADGLVTIFPRDAPASADIGGSMVHAFGGVKAGVRRDRVGLFGRAAIGIVRHGNVVSSFEPGSNPPVLSYGPVNNTAWQFGGVIEVYPSRHWLLRIDAIDMIIPAHTSKLLIAGENNDFETSGTHAIVLNFGMGWRF